MKKETLKPKRKMQDVHFKSVQDFLEYLPMDELEIVEKLRELIYQAIPDIQEKLAYNVPYYKRHANICFIWPASVPWGKMMQPGVRLGFTKGYMLEDEIGFLDKGNRKEVYSRDFLSPQQIDETLVLTYLAKASDVDEEIYQAKR